MPGADTWGAPQYIDDLSKTKDLLNVGGTVAAICGATVALGNTDILDEYKHISNSLGFLQQFCPIYSRVKIYLDKIALVDDNLITTGSTGSLLWTKYIIQKLGVFNEDTLEGWYDYFKAGNADYFFDLMKTLPNDNV